MYGVRKKGASHETRHHFSRRERGKKAKAGACCLCAASLKNKIICFNPLHAQLPPLVLSHLFHSILLRDIQLFARSAPAARSIPLIPFRSTSIPSHFSGARKQPNARWGKESRGARSARLSPLYPKRYNMTRVLQCRCTYNTGRRFFGSPLARR